MKKLSMIVCLFLVAAIGFAGTSGVTNKVSKFHQPRPGGDEDGLAAKVEDTIDDIVTKLDAMTTTDGIEPENLNSGVVPNDVTFGDIVSTGKTVKDVVVVTDTNAYTVLAANAGKVHLVPNLTADSTISLPAEAEDLHYKFVYVGGAADAQDWLITSGDDDKYFIGGVVTVDPGQTNAGSPVAANIYSDGDSNSKLTIETPEAGTVIELWCQLGAATNWYVSGTVISDTDTGAAFADQ